MPTKQPAQQHRSLTPPPRHEPPPGWTPELDRREEYADLSMLVVLRKAG